ncbi:MAG TPA: M48 family metalloprotease [Nitrospirae bacterium]|nr:M48 family metalloprotease [Nitrospirota bacterium]
MKRFFLIFFILFCYGCLSTGSTDLTGHLKTIKTATEELSKASRPISDVEEYYVGRALAARILTNYKVLNNALLIDYINLVGLSIAMHSERPNTYGGYHFTLLDTMEKNAFACPGGIIFITKGMLLSAKSEDELAAILAHEIAHINNKDGISSIKSARWTEALTIIGTQVARTYTSAEISKLVSLFEGAIDDVFKTIVVNGYSQQQEFSADEKAVNYLKKAGYNPKALVDFITNLNVQGSSGGGIMNTHPSSSARLEKLMETTFQIPVDISSMNNRLERFKAVIKKTIQ